MALGRFSGESRILRTPWSCASRWPFSPSVSWPRTLLAHRFFNPLIRVFYTLASVWLGFVSFFFLAACASWMCLALPFLFGVHLEKQIVAAVCFGLGLLGRHCRHRKCGVAARRAGYRAPSQSSRSPGAGAPPRSISDLHLGHVRNAGFLRRLVRKLSRLQSGRCCLFPAICLMGPRWIFAPLTKAWAGFSAPSRFLLHHRQPRTIHQPDAISRGRQKVRHPRAGQRKDRSRRPADCGHRLLSFNARGALPIDPPANALGPECGQHFAGAQSESFARRRRGWIFAADFRATPIAGSIFRSPPSFPGCTENLRTACIDSAHLAVYTSCGVGTWGPPMRLGSNPEIVLLQFE